MSAVQCGEMITEYVVMQLNVIGDFVAIFLNDHIFMLWDNSFR